MIGNVFQWCGDEVVGAPPKRVLRGGSYNMNVETCRAAFRGFSKAEGRYSYTGFRIAVGIAATRD
jgi:formylglycine-generating enzyme required for sulfatase activity